MAQLTLSLRAESAKRCTVLHRTLFVRWIPPILLCDLCASALHVFSALFSPSETVNCKLSTEDSLSVPSTLPPTRCDTLPMFSPTLLDHFQSPRNAGELPNPTAKIEVTNPVCGDVLQLSVQLEHTRIVAARFLCRGCTASIACASLLTELIQGRELHELNAITADHVSTAIGGLPEASNHAAHLAQAALQSLLRHLDAL